MRSARAIRLVQCTAGSGDSGDEAPVRRLLCGNRLTGNSHFHGLGVSHPGWEAEQSGTGGEEADAYLGDTEFGPLGGH